MAITKINYPLGLTTTLFDDFYQFFNANADKLTVAGSMPTNGVLRMQNYDLSTYDILLANFEDKVLTGLNITINGVCNGPFTSTVNVGSYQINGTVYNITSPVILPISGLHPTLDRIDVVYATSAGLFILTGTPANTPSTPSLIATQISVAVIYVKSILNCTTPSIISVSDYPNFKRLDANVSAENNGSIMNFSVGSGNDIQAGSCLFNFIFGERTIIPNNGANFSFNTLISNNDLNVEGSSNFVSNSKDFSLIGNNNFVWGINTEVLPAQTFSNNIIFGELTELGNPLYTINANNSVFINSLDNFFTAPLSNHTVILNSKNNEMRFTNDNFCSVISCKDGIMPDFAEYSIFSGNENLFPNPTNIYNSFSTGYNNSYFIDVGNSILAGSTNTAPIDLLGGYNNAENSLICGSGNTIFGGHNIINGTNNYCYTSNSIITGINNSSFGYVAGQTRDGNIIFGTGNILADNINPLEQTSNNLLGGENNEIISKNSAILSSFDCGITYPFSTILSSQEVSTYGLEYSASIGLDLATVTTDARLTYFANFLKPNTVSIANLKLGGSLFVYPKIVTTAIYNVTRLDHILFFKGTSNVAVTIPATYDRNDGMILVIKNDSNVKNITITDLHLADNTIEGLTTITLTSANEILKLLFIFSEGWVKIL